MFGDTVRQAVCMCGSLFISLSVTMVLFLSHSGRVVLSLKGQLTQKTKMSRNVAFLWCDLVMVNVFGFISPGFSRYLLMSWLI